MNKLTLTCALSLCAVAVGFVGCTDRTELVDVETDTEIVAGLDYKDFEHAATETTKAILLSNKLADATRERGRIYGVAISKVEDATPLSIDTDLITTRISEALLQDDRFVISAVFADKASNRDAMVGTVREVRDDAEFNQSTVQAEGQLKAPDFSLSGKIIGRDVRRDNGGHQYEYYFQLRLTNLATGNVLMVKETKIIKRTGSKSHTW